MYAQVQVQASYAYSLMFYTYWCLHCPMLHVHAPYRCLLLTSMCIMDFGMTNLERHGWSLRHSFNSARVTGLHARYHTVTRGSAMWEWATRESFKAASELGTREPGIRVQESQSNT